MWKEKQGWGSQGERGALDGDYHCRVALDSSLGGGRAWFMSCRQAAEGLGGGTGRVTSVISVGYIFKAFIAEWCRVTRVCGLARCAVLFRGVLAVASLHTWCMHQVQKQKKRRKNVPSLGSGLFLCSSTFCFSSKAFFRCKLACDHGN